MRGRRDVGAEVRRMSLRLLELGKSPSFVARHAHVSVDTVRKWWRDEHPNLPMRHGTAEPARRVDEWVRRVRVITYECPHCGGLIQHPVIDTEVPWRCEWCGEELR